MRYPLEYDDKNIDDLIEMSTEEVVGYLVYMIKKSSSVSKVAFEKLCMIIDRLKEQNNVTHINKVDLQELSLMRDGSLDTGYIVKEKEIVEVIPVPQNPILLEKHDPENYLVDKDTGKPLKAKVIDGNLHIPNQENSITMQERQKKKGIEKLKEDIDAGVRKGGKHVMEKIKIDFGEKYDPFFYKYKIGDVLVTRMGNKYTVVNKRNGRYECKLKEKRGRYAMKELMMSDETIDHQATLLLMEDKG